MLDPFKQSHHHTLSAIKWKMKKKKRTAHSIDLSVYSLAAHRNSFQLFRLCVCVWESWSFICIGMRRSQSTMLSHQPDYIHPIVHIVHAIQYYCVRHTIDGYITYTHTTNQMNTHHTKTIWKTATNSKKQCSRAPLLMFMSIVCIGAVTFRENGFQIANEINKKLYVILYVCTKANGKVNFTNC